MHVLVRYLKSVVCMHDWRTEELEIKRFNPFNGKMIDRDIRVHQSCQRCPAHRNYSKFGKISGAEGVVHSLMK